MTEASIVINNGTVTALAGGPVSLATLGPRKTRRVSNIEYSPYDEEWVVTRPATREVLFRHADYDVALQRERDHFNHLLKTTPEKFL